MSSIMSGEWSFSSNYALKDAAQAIFHEIHTVIPDVFLFLAFSRHAFTDLFVVCQ
ncbi:hypothetical protein STEG23_029472, partial [Scotinomys teguina]